MAQITLTRKASSFDEDSGSYRFQLEATSSQGMPKEIFVKQRIYKAGTTSGTEDFFAAICTPEQLESLPVGAPELTIGFYRSDKIDVVARTPEMLATIFQDILKEVQNLIEDVEILEDLADEDTYTITAGNIVIS
jgi:hypothetical protein